MSDDIHDFISTRQIGEATISLVGEMAGPALVVLNVPEELWREQMPEIDRTGLVPSGMTVTVVQLGDAVLVIDPSFGDPGSRLRNEVDAEYPHWNIGPGLQAALEILGIANDEVTHVIITHAHFDHCLGLTIEQDEALHPRFPAARHFLGKADWRDSGDRCSTALPGGEDVFVRWSGLEMWPRLQAIHDAGLLELIDGPHSVTPAVMMLPAPGESPGHCVIRVASDGEVFYHLGDLVHYWFEFEHPGWIIDEPSSERDLEAMQTSRRYLLPRLASENALVTFTHAGFPGWGQIVPHRDGFRWKPLM